MRDMPTVDELLGDTTDPPPPVRAILCVVGSNEDDSGGPPRIAPLAGCEPRGKGGYRANQALPVRLDRPARAVEALRKAGAAIGDFPRPRDAGLKGE